MVHAMKDELVDNSKVFKSMLEDAEKPLYPNCIKNTKFCALIKMYNFKVKH